MTGTSDVELQPDRPVLGLWLRVGSIAAFSGMALCVKLVASEVPTGQIVFYRSLFAIIPLVIFLWLRGEFPRGLETRRPFGHLLRCLAGCAAMFTAFASLRYLPLADYTLIGFLTPFVTIVMAKLVLGESVSPRGWAGVGLGFAGVVVLVWPELHFDEQRDGYLPGVMLGLGTALLTALAKIQIRSLSRTESAGAIAFYFAVTCTLAGAASGAFAWAPTSAALIWPLIGAGLLGGVAHIAMTLGIQFCPLARQAGLDYLSLFFAVTLDITVLAIVPGVWTSAAIVLIFAAVCMGFSGKS